MPEFTVQHSYASNHNGRRFGPWAEGDAIDLDAADAEWVNRDSPGTLAGCELEEQTAEPGEPLPDLPESAYPADAVELEPVALDEPVAEEKPKPRRTRSRS